MDIEALDSMSSEYAKADQLEKEASRLYQQALRLFDEAKRIRGEQSRRWQSEMGRLANHSTKG